METIVTALQNLVGYSVPTLLVIGGLLFIIYPFLDVFIQRPIPNAQKKSARNLGFGLLLVGIALSLVTKPAQPQGQQPSIVFQLPEPKPTTRPETLPSPPLLTSSPTIAMPTLTSLPPTPNPSPTTALPTNTTVPPTTTPPSPSPTRPLPTATMLPTPTATSEAVTYLIPVQSFEENGVRVNIPTSGLYQVAYLNDAYSPWPNEQSEGYQGWTTITYIYQNGPVKWGKTEYGLQGPISHNDYLGPGGYYLEKERAIAVSRGEVRRFRLQAGDYLTFVVLDEKGRYADNRGKVDVGITYIGGQ